MNELIAELEQAQEGSRELDARIAVIADYDYEDVHGRKFIEVFWDFRAFQKADIDSWRVPHYTTNLQEALALVAGDLEYSISKFRAGKHTERPGFWFHAEIFNDGSRPTDEGKSLATPALALCIAALKAREG